MHDCPTNIALCHDIGPPKKIATSARLLVVQLMIGVAKGDVSLYLLYKQLKSSEKAYLRITLKESIKDTGCLFNVVFFLKIL